MVVFIPYTKEVTNHKVATYFSLTCGLILDSHSPSYIMKTLCTSMIFWKLFHISWVVNHNILLCFTPKPMGKSEVVNHTLICVFHMLYCKHKEWDNYLCIAHSIYNEDVPNSMGYSLSKFMVIWATYSTPFIKLLKVTIITNLASSYNIFSGQTYHHY